jgi:RNA polymerase sigma factor (TIGR02999 family)
MDASSYGTQESRNLTADPDRMSEKKDAGGPDGLAALLYEDLRKVARREHFRAGRPDTLQTTAVLHEAYLRLSDGLEWESRDHFMATASTAMRYVLVDAARARQAAKRGGGERPLPIDSAAAIADDQDAELVRLGEALHELQAFDADLARLVDLRFFAGMTDEETARILGISDRTVRRRWLQARAWLYRAVTE